MYQKASKGWMKHLDFMAVDLLCLQLSYVIAYYIRHRDLVPVGNRVYRNMIFVLFLTQVFVTYFSESFKNVLKRGRYAEFTATMRHVCLVVLIASFYLFVTQDGEYYSRLTMMLMGGIYIVFSFAGRNLWKHYLKRRGIDGKRCRSLLILTSQSMLGTVAENIRGSRYAGFWISGIALLDGNLENFRTGDGEVEIVADRSTVLEYVCREWVDEVFINLPKQMEPPEDLIEELVEMGVTVHLKLMKMAKLTGQKQTVERLGTYTVLTSSINMASLKQTFYKRALDIVGGITGCLITALLFVLIGPMIYIKSPGPVIFSQIRVGKNGRKFRFYKFRSMYMDAEERKKDLMGLNRVKDGMMFKLDHDPRIIGGEHGIGAFIRRTSIDEFPQFWNVLKGDMSLVGTRPPTVDEWEKYDLHHRVRLAIKPGITGMWQVSGRSGITEFEEVVRLDREYIINWSFGLDLKILCKTIMVVFGQNGSI